MLHYPVIDDAEGASLLDVLGELEAVLPDSPAPQAAAGADSHAGSAQDDEVWVIESSADDLASIADLLPEGTVLLRELAAG